MERSADLLQTRERKVPIRQRVSVQMMYRNGVKLILVLQASGEGRTYEPMKKIPIRHSSPGV